MEKCNLMRGEARRQTCRVGKWVAGRGRDDEAPGAVVWKCHGALTTARVCVCCAGCRRQEVGHLMAYLPACRAVFVFVVSSAECGETDVQRGVSNGAIERLCR